MKKIFLGLLVVFALIGTACDDTKKDGLTVAVTNTGDAQRINETVELDWLTLAGRLENISVENVVVTDAHGKQIPSQVVYAGQTAPQLLIFQATVNGNATAEYTIKPGSREAYKDEAFGRFVPERKDDYAWENNVVTFRIYGPALEKELVTNGIDYWSKSTSDLVIDRWYEMDLSGAGSYHHDTGEGADCYKVGPTVGMGASAPVLDNKLWYSRNFTSWKRLDNGPIRTTVELTYSPFKVGDNEVTLVKTISLDANSNFNKMTDVYGGNVDQIEVAAGVIIHEDAQIQEADGYSALYEPASDSQTGEDGDIGGAIILPGSRAATVEGTMVRIAAAKMGEPFVYYAGAGTSKRDMTDAQTWFDHVAKITDAVKNPLKVELK